MSDATILVLDPTAKANVPEGEMAPRLDSLEGKVVGFLNSSKPNVDVLFERIEEILRARFSIRRTVSRRKFDAAFPVSEEALEALGKCDFVINGVGD